MTGRYPFRRHLKIGVRILLTLSDVELTSAFPSETWQNLLVDFHVSEIAPENHPRPEDVIQCCRTTRVVDDGCHIMMIQGYLADIMTTGE